MDENLEVALLGLLGLVLVASIFAPNHATVLAVLTFLERHAKIVALVVVYLAFLGLLAKVL